MFKDEMYKCSLVENLKVLKFEKMFAIAEWYEGKDRRLRLEIYKEKTGFRHEWTKIRTENNSKLEETLNPNQVNFERLKNLKSVFKIRYVIQEKPQISVDEFVEIDEKKPEKLNGMKFLLKKDVRVGYVDKLSFENEIEIPDCDDFDLAFDHGLSPYKIMEFLQNRLLGPVNVIAMQGKSLHHNLKNELGFDLFKDYSKFDDELKKLEDMKLEKVCGFSAELDSLLLMKKKGFDIDKVTYVVFPDPENDTKEGIPKIFSPLAKLTKFSFHCKVDKFYLDYNPNNEESVINSVKKLWNFLEESFSDKDHEIIIDVAGGQKYPSIVASLYCLLNNKPFYYKQNKGILTKFPPVPISWNFNVLDENLSAFKLAKNCEDEGLKYEDYLSLPGFFKDLFELSGHSEISTPLPLKKIYVGYEKARKMPFGYGQRFIDLIDNEEMKEFIIEKITKKWSLMWIGDQIPETVEHSQRHSKRLMEFSVNLVNTIGEESFLRGVPLNLRDEFYFVLAVAMNVHDLGHTALSYIFPNGKTLSLNGLPSVVRDLHNELSYQMLTNPKEKKFYALLDGIEKIANAKNLEKAISLVSRYHRQIMPIDSVVERQKEYLKIFKLNPVPLNEVVKKEFKEKEWQELTIAASRWLKFIDGTDVQSDRIVMEEYNDMRTWRTQMEVVNLCDDLLNDDEVWKRKEFSNLKGLVEDIRELALEDVKTNSFLLEDKSKKIEKKLYSILKESIENAKSSYVTVDELLRKLDKLAFKARQFPHFKKHQIVSAIYPKFYERKSHGIRKNILHIVIDYNHDDESSKIMEGIKEDIKKEFENANLSFYDVKGIEIELNDKK